MAETRASFCRRPGSPRVALFAARRRRHTTPAVSRAGREWPALAGQPRRRAGATENSASQRRLTRFRRPDGPDRRSPITKRNARIALSGLWRPERATPRIARSIPPRCGAASRQPARRAYAGHLPRSRDRPSTTRPEPIGSAAGRNHANRNSQVPPPKTAVSPVSSAKLSTVWLGSRARGAVRASLASQARVGAPGVCGDRDNARRRVSRVLYRLCEQPSGHPRKR